MNNKAIMERFKQELPDLVGNIQLNFVSNTVMLSGDIYTKEEEKFKKILKEILNEFYPNSFFTSSLKLNEFCFSTNDFTETNHKKEKNLDEVNIIYYGYLPTNLIQFETKFRHPHLTMQVNLEKIDRCIKVLNFISPIILDKNLKVIDGNKRLELAKINEIKKVLVVVVDDDSLRADFLRLALNRTQEFQRWNFENVDEYVDNVPQAQPILEPLGFFGKKLLPVSFFTNTVLDYVIDPFNEKQMQYKQEYGLAEWAKYRREQMLAEAERRKPRKKKIYNENTISLFDLHPKEEDFLETNDFQEVFNEYSETWTKEAEKITKMRDEIRKKETAEQGVPWQIPHRSPREVAIDNRQEAIDFISEHPQLDEEEKGYILENLNDFAEIFKDISLVKEKLKEIFKNKEN